MALTSAQKKWAVGGSIAAAALFVGYELFHSRLAHAGLLPAGRSHGGHDRHSKHHRPEGRDEHARENGQEERENERGEYGRKKKHHHHGGHKHD